MELVGGVASIILVVTGVAMGALTSKTMTAWLVIWLPVASPAAGTTLYIRNPSPWPWASSGGRKPASGSVTKAPVTGSMDCIVQVSTPVAGLSEALTATGLGSVLTLTLVEKDCTPDGTLMITLLNEIAVNCKVDQLRLVVRASVTVTNCAG